MITIKRKDTITYIKNNQQNNKKITTKYNKQNINAVSETVEKKCSPGKIKYKGKCLLEMTQESCKKKDPFFKPDDSKTKCVRKTYQEIAASCKEGETFHDGICMKIKDSNNCKEELFLEPDPTKNNTVCRTMSEEKKNQVCKKNNKTFFKNGCFNQVTEEECRKKESITKEKQFHLFPDEKTKLTSCREPNDSEKHNLCSQSGFKYDETQDKCVCPGNSKIVEGICISIKTDDICFPPKTATLPTASFTMANSNDNLNCIPMTNDQKDDYCKKYGIDDKSTTNSGPAPAPSPATAPKYVYYQNKCTKLKSTEDCKSIKYDDIFYKKPDKSTQKNIL